MCVCARALACVCVCLVVNLCFQRGSKRGEIFELFAYFQNRGIWGWRWEGGEDGGNIFPGPFSAGNFWFVNAIPGKGITFSRPGGNDNKIVCVNYSTIVWYTFNKLTSQLLL